MSECINTTMLVNLYHWPRSQLNAWERDYYTTGQCAGSFYNCKNNMKIDTKVQIKWFSYKNILLADWLEYSSY